MNKLLGPIVLLLVILLLFIGFTNNWFDGIFGGGDTVITQGFVETDPFWDTKGDLAVGSANNTASRVTLGTAGYFLRVATAQPTGIEWSNVLPPIGNLSITDATESSTKDTGAVVIANGGLGVELNIRSGGGIYGVIVAAGSNHATGSGSIFVPNGVNAGLAGRNSANTANIRMIELDTSNTLLLNDSILQVTAGGNVFLNDSANSKTTSGFTINQLAADDSIQSWKSSDVAHGITDVTETNTFIDLAKASSTEGGALITGLRGGSGTIGILIRGIGTFDNTTHTAASDGFVGIFGGKKNGTAIGAPGANANLLVVGHANDGSVKFIVDAEGDLFADGSDVTVYDHENDLNLLRDIRICQTEGKNSALNIKYGSVPISYSCSQLETMGFITMNLLPVSVEKDRIITDDAGKKTVESYTENVNSAPFVNLKALSWLGQDAIRQLAEDTDAKFALLEARIAALESK